MSTKAAVSIDEYLRSSYESPDPEFSNGEVIERALPKWLHAKTQARVVLLFLRSAASKPVFAGTEVRLRLRKDRVVIADVAVFSPDEPVEEVPASPPTVVVEILSPDDRMSETTAKLAEYESFGVPHVWLIDPAQRILYVSNNGLRAVSSLDVPELGLCFPAAEIFGPAIG